MAANKYFAWMALGMWLSVITVLLLYMSSNISQGQHDILTLQRQNQKLMSQLESKGAELHALKELSSLSYHQLSTINRQLEGLSRPLQTKDMQLAPPSSTSMMNQQTMQPAQPSPRAPILAHDAANQVTTVLPEISTRESPQAQVADAPKYVQCSLPFKQMRVLLPSLLLLVYV